MKKKKKKGRKRWNLDLKIKKKKIFKWREKEGINERKEIKKIIESWIEKRKVRFFEVEMRINGIGWLRIDCGKRIKIELRV